SSRCSSRLPEAIQTPSDAVSRCRIASVTTLMPDFRVVTSTLMLPLLPAPPGSSPGQTSQPPIDRRGAPLCVPAVHLCATAIPEARVGCRRLPPRRLETSPHVLSTARSRAQSGHGVLFPPPRPRPRYVDR